MRLCLPCEKIKEIRIRQGKCIIMIYVKRAGEKRLSIFLKDEKKNQFFISPDYLIRKIEKFTCRA